MAMKHAHGLEEVFDREEYLQMIAAREYMKRHFRNGKDPPPLTFDKGIVTSVNMLSEKRTETEAEKRARQHAEAMEERTKQSMTELKMENCLLVQQNTEWKQQIDEMKELLKDQKVKIMYFEDLNVDEIKKIKADYQNMELRLAETLEMLQNIENC